MLAREEEFYKVSSLLESQFPAILVVGPPKCGKSILINEVMKSFMPSAQVSCLSASIRVADIFEDILRQIGVEDSCPNFAEFVHKLNKLDLDTLAIVLKNADRLRYLDQHLLPGLTRLNELVHNIKISVVLVSKFPWSKWRLTHYMAASPPVQVFIKPYTRNQLSLILHDSLKDVDEPQVLKKNFIDLVLGTFQPVCKSWPQFKRAADLLWPEYVKPTKETPNVEPENARSLYRSVECHVKRIMANIHYQEAPSMMGEESKSKRLNVELPFFSKFLLLSAYLASYNPVSADKRFFMKGRLGRRVVKKSKMKHQAHQRSSQLLGPKMFDLNRMLAIFHVIVDQKVTSTADIQSQVASLVTLQMLTQSGDDLDQPKYKCNVSLDFIRQVAKNVRFELHKYLYDVDY